MFMSRFYLFAVLAICVYLPLLVSAESTTTSTTTSSSSPAAAVSPAVLPPPIPAGAIALSPVAQDRIKNLAANLSNRQDAAVRRLENVSVRLESRAKILETAGQDVSLARTRLASAQQNLDQAKATLSGIDSAVTSFIGSASPRENWATLKLTYTDTGINIRAAYDALVLALAALENAGTVTNATASTTPDSTSTSTAESGE